MAAFDARSFDAAVIGAGISGAAAALELAEAGLSVVLIDRWGPAAMGSGWTLAGVRQSGRHPAELPLARAAVRCWSTLSERLGADVSYRQHGNLRLARTEAEVPVIEALVTAQSAAGLDVTLLRGAEIQALAPAISPSVLAACWCPSDGHADPHAAVQALVDAAIRAGAVTRFGAEVLAIETDAGRVTGVRLAGETIACTRAVLAAGVLGNALLAPLGARVPLEIKVVSAIRTAPVPPLLAPVIGVANADCAGRQQADGCFRVTCGARPFTGTIENGPRPRVLPQVGALADVSRLFGHLVPAFPAMPVDETWAGLIDLTPDALPVLDHVPGAEGLMLAMGFSGHGFCLGPVTGQVLADLALGRPSRFDLAPFRLARFDGWNAPAEPVTLHG